MSRPPSYAGHDPSRPVTIGHDNGMPAIKVVATGLVAGMRVKQERWVTGSGVAAELDRGTIVEIHVAGTSIGNTIIRQGPPEARTEEIVIPRIDPTAEHELAKRDARIRVLEAELADARAKLGADTAPTVANTTVKAAAKRPAKPATPAPDAAGAPPAAAVGADEPVTA